MHDASNTTGQDADPRGQAGDSPARRRFLTGGAVAAAAAVGATAFNASPAHAQTDVQFVYLPLGPTRVYDSRLAGGRLSSGAVRTIDTYPSVDIGAFAFNLTVTQTTSSGWLAVYPFGDAYSGTSSINWFASGQTMANNVYTWLGQQPYGAINIRCGGGGASTHFVIDVVAALVALGLPPAGASPASAGAAERLPRLEVAPWADLGED